MTAPRHFAIAVMWALVLATVGSESVLSQDDGRVFGREWERSWRRAPPRDEAPRRPAVEREDLAPLSPGSSEEGEERGSTPPIESAAPPVEPARLAPPQAGSGLPADLWGDLPEGELEKLLAQLDIPPRSPALYEVWLKLIRSSATPPGRSRAEDAARFTALRAEALFRSGLIGESRKVLDSSATATTDAIARVLVARNDIALGNRDEGCAAIDSMGGHYAELPQVLRREALLAQGYCAAVAGNPSAAGLAAELAREEGLAPTPGLSVLDALAAGTKPVLAASDMPSVIDYRLVELAGGMDKLDLIKHGAPPLLAAIALDPRGDPHMTLLAGEAAARVNAITPLQLADIYRAADRGERENGTQPAEAMRQALAAALARTREFSAVERERDAARRFDAVRVFLDDAARVGLLFAAAEMVRPLVEDIEPSRDAAPFAETAIMVALAAADYEKARRWAGLYPRPEERNINRDLEPWLALADIADAKWSYTRGAALPTLEPLAAGGRFSPQGLHRLATVLDALGYQVPVPLWDAASRTPQPDGGHLPETGVLSDLDGAAKKQAFAKTVLLVMVTLGPDSADNTHIIALGDSIRALKRAGLETEARRLGLEALLSYWPRRPSPRS